MKITNFHYGNVAFSKGDFVEYPKWVHREGKPSVIAENAEEESALLAGSEPVMTELPPEPKPSGPVLVGNPDERDLLIQIAREKNIKIDARWKTDRIRDTLERAELCQAR